MIAASKEMLQHMCGNDGSESDSVYDEYDLWHPDDRETQANEFPNGINEFSHRGVK